MLQIKISYLDLFELAKQHAKMAPNSGKKAIPVIMLPSKAIFSFKISLSFIEQPVGKMPVEYSVQQVVLLRDTQQDFGIFFLGLMISQSLAPFTPQHSSFS